MMFFIGDDCGILLTEQTESLMKLAMVNFRAHYVMTNLGRMHAQDLSLQMLSTWNLRI